MSKEVKGFLMLIGAIVAYDAIVKPQLIKAGILTK